MAYISIIVPIYNAEKSIVNCIESVLAQTYEKWELLLVDDGSRDLSRQICEQYISNRIKYFHQENKGVSAARNYGLNNATGDYVIFLDADDELEPNMLEKLLGAISESNADLVICGCIRNTKRMQRLLNIPSQLIVGKKQICVFTEEYYMKWLVASPWGKLYVRSKIANNRFDEKIALGEDLLFNIQYFEKIDSIKIIEDSLYCYNDCEESLTRSYRKGNYESICKIYDYSRRFILDNSDLLASEIKNVNYKLFSFCISFMSQNISKSSYREEIYFIDMICTNEALQEALCNLPHLDLVRRCYVRLIKDKRILLLYLLSWVKLILNDRL